MVNYAVQNAEEREGEGVEEREIERERERDGETDRIVCALNNIIYHQYIIMLRTGFNFNSIIIACIIRIIG